MASVFQFRKFLQLHRVARRNRATMMARPTATCGRTVMMKKHEDITVHCAVEAREGHCSQGRRTEHQLQTHVNDQRVPAQQTPKNPMATAAR